MRRIWLGLALALAAAPALAQDRSEIVTQCEHGDSDAMIRACTTLIQLGQETAEHLSVYYVDRAAAEGQKGLFDQALADADQAVKLDPQDEAAYVDRAHAHETKGQYDAALADLATALVMKPADEQAYYVRGLVDTRRRLYDAAIADFAQAVAIKSDFEDAWRRRGAAYYDKGRQIQSEQGGVYDEAVAKLYDQAIADFNRAMSLTANGPIYGDFLRRGRALNAHGYGDAAIADFTKAIALKADDAEAYFERGNAYKDETGGYQPGESGFKERLDHAISDYNQAIVLLPNYEAAYEKRCEAHYHGKDYPLAIADCTKAISISPTDAAAWGDRALVYGDMGETAKARRDLAKFTALTHGKP